LASGFRANAEIANAAKISGQGKLRDEVQRHHPHHGILNHGYKQRSIVVAKLALKAASQEVPINGIAQVIEEGRHHGTVLKGCGAQVNGWQWVHDL
jgi:hypothetical protein